MFRIFLFFIVIALVAAGFSWLADLKGSLTLEVGGQNMQFSILQTVVALLFVVAGIILAWTILKGVFTAPGNIARTVRNRRENKSLDALSKGLIAANAGDAKQAKKLAKKASKTLKHQPMSAVLRAQAAQLAGDQASARRIYEAMLESPDTELMGLRGLYDEARRVNELVAARQFAERAIHLNPNLAWAITALLEIQSRSGEWHNARQTLKLASLNKLVPAKTAKRHRAVLLAAEAMELEVDDASEALKLALESHRLAPDLVPAAEVSGRILASQGKASKTASIIYKTWEYSPHPDLALVYAHARPGDSVKDRLKRVKQLANKKPDSIESPIAVATTAIDAKLWKEAREALNSLLEDNPPARVCTLMAQIEAGEFGDKGRVREWLARAVKAPRDPVWIADGFISEHWLPVSPVTGKLDAFVWDTPKESASIHENRLALGDHLAESTEVLAASAKDAELLADAPSEVLKSDKQKSSKGANDSEGKTPTVSSSSVPNPKKSETGVNNKSVEPEDAVIIDDVSNEKQNTKSASATDAGAKKSGKPVDAAQDAQKSPEKDNPGKKPVTTAKPKINTKKKGRKPAGNSDGSVDKNNKEAIIFVAPRAPDDPGPSTVDVDNGADNKNLAERYRTNN